MMGGLDNNMRVGNAFGNVDQFSLPTGPGGPASNFSQFSNFNQNPPPNFQQNQTQQLQQQV